jgi:hypothetical protein
VIFNIIFDKGIFYEVIFKKVNFDCSKFFDHLYGF